MLYSKNLFFKTFISYYVKLKIYNLIFIMKNTFLKEKNYIKS